MAKVRFGLVQLQHSHAQGHAGTLKRLVPDAELVAVTDDSMDKAREFATRFGIEALGYDELLGRSDIDAVVILANSEDAARHCVNAARAGKHIMCEKPLGITIEDTKNIENAVRSAGVRLQVAFTLRFDRLYIAGKKLIDSGAIGNVVNIWSARRHRTSFGSFWGGGETLEHGVHDFDLLRWYTGQEVVSVFALANKVNRDDGSVGQVTFPNPIPNKLPFEDTSIVTLRFANEIIGGLTFGSLSPDNQPYWADATLEVIGTKGLLRVSMTQDTLVLHTDEGVRYPRIADGLPPKYAGMYQEFLQALKKDREPSGGLYDGIAATRIAAEAYESIRLGVPRQIEPLSNDAAE